MWIFAGYHLWLVSRNTTTSETFKWGDAKEYIEYCRALIDNPNLVDKRTGIRPEVTKDMKAWAKRGPLVNIYNRGLRENFKEVLFPHSWHKKKQKAS